jgi:glycosyltransferase involved in cell wall biosynthesis
MAQAVNVMQKRSAKEPLVSVVMSVFNGEKYLHEAINSILQQTFTDFEFIIVDDGSTDSTCRIIQSYNDSRIFLISRANKGLVASLNEAILSAKGIYIGRQDADDVSHSARLQTEVFFLRNNPKYVAVGSWFEEFNEGSPLRINRTPVTDSLVRLRLVWGTCFGHGSVMFVRQAAIDAGLYRQAMWPAEDYDLWTRLSSFGALANIPRVLYRYRLHKESISEKNSSKQRQLAKEISLSYALKFRRNDLGSIHHEVECITKADPEYQKELIAEMKREILRLRSYPEVKKAFLRYLRHLRLKTWLAIRLRLLTSFRASSL